MCMTNVSLFIMSDECVNNRHAHVDICSPKREGRGYLSDE